MPTKGIIVKSRQGLVTFGEGLAADELRFLKSILTKASLGRGNGSASQEPDNGSAP